MEYNKCWTILDKLISKLRYYYVDKYVKENEVIVDIGCGIDGTFLKRHQKKILEGYGFDSRIEEYHMDNLHFINNNGLNELPLSSNSVDIVFLNAVLEHLEKPVEVLSSAIRILKSEGVLVMTTPTLFSKPILEFMAYKIHIINEHSIREHKHYYSHKDIENLVEDLNSNCHIELVKYKYFELGLNSLIVIQKS